MLFLAQDGNGLSVSDVANVAGAVIGGAGLALAILSLYFSMRKNVVVRIHHMGNIPFRGDELGEPFWTVNVTLGNRSGLELTLQRLTVAFPRGKLLHTLDPRDYFAQQGAVPHGGGKSISFPREHVVEAARQLRTDGWISIWGHAEDGSGRTFRSPRHKLNVRTGAIRPVGLRRLGRWIKRLWRGPSGP